MAVPPSRFGAFIAPHHDPRIDATLQIRRDVELIELLEQLGYDEAWVGEHHSSGHETIACPEMVLASAGERTNRIRLGTGVNSMPYHNPLMLIDRLVLLDHLTRGRAMLGMGPGQLASDAFMLGIDPAEQRDMMIESAEVIVELLAGNKVTRTTSWFDLREAHLQLLPHNPAGLEIAVASVVSPTGAILAGRLGLGMLSLAATDPRGFSALDVNWGHLERAAARAGHPTDRGKWRVLVAMHLAETREQARKEAESGILGSLVGYIESLTGKPLPYGADPALAVEQWSTRGFPGFGIATVGTPDDAIATIEPKRSFRPCAAARPLAWPAKRGPERIQMCCSAV
ncbi:MAG: LLM class flavin-dependent oxidoreductase [Actinobacteria bacterium]|nr:MAG: LLM class flavin-dependent oxidoreductase [Actinomycetota bacterium]